MKISKEMKYSTDGVKKLVHSITHSAKTLTREQALRSSAKSGRFLFREASMAAHFQEVYFGEKDENLFHCGKETCLSQEVQMEKKPAAPCILVYGS